MKALLLFLLGAVVGALAYHFHIEYHGRRSPPPDSPPRVTAPLPTPPAVEPTATEKFQTTARELGAKTRDAARDAGQAINEKLTDWKLRPEDLREDLKRGGEIVRTKASQAGAKLSDARVLTVIKAKYVLDRDLSALDIAVTVQAGRVTLTGTVDSSALVGHAIALALDTDGVVAVSSRLTTPQPEAAR